MFLSTTGLWWQGTQALNYLTTLTSPYQAAESDRQPACQQLLEDCAKRLPGGRTSARVESGAWKAD